MAIKFQYNKTSLQDLNKQLRVRLTALPTLKNKEAALRTEVKKARDRAAALAGELERRQEENRAMARLWSEFDPALLRIGRARLGSRKIAGVRIPVLEEVSFEEAPYSRFNRPHWYADGLVLLREVGRLVVEKQVAERRVELLEQARKKTTQKVNLYEKVQIPGYEQAILKIKRFLEDEENLSKSAQKIVKKRQADRRTDEQTV